MRLIGLAVIPALGLLATLLVPGAAVAQGRIKSPRIAILNPGAPEYFNDPRTCPNGFMQGLRDLGYVEGHNAQLEYRHARGQVTRLDSLAAELVRLSPDVIWTHSSDAIQAVKRATATIPIVFGVAINSVEEGLVAALSRPGGNVTGLELRDIELTGKRLQLLKEALPTVSRVAVLVNPDLPGHEHVPGNVEPQARALGIQLQRVEARTPETFEAAFSAMVQARAHAAIIMDGTMFARHRHRIFDIALKRKLPTMSGGRHFAEAGGLIAYGAFPRELCQRSAVLVDKILKGAKPADLPVELGDRFYLVLNLKTAKALGLTIPASILVQADQVIE
jgi:putative tryptophan/tyrosine transport system substrate-binding protein